MTLFILSLIWLVSGHGAMFWMHSREKKKYPEVTDKDLIKDVKLVPYVVLSSLGVLTLISALFCEFMSNVDED